MRLSDRVAIVVGAGQSPGEGVGNGRATAHHVRARRREGVVRRSQSRERAGDGRDDRAATAAPRSRSKPTSRTSAALAAMVEDARARWGRIDVLHNNVGVSISGGDAQLLDLTEAAFDRCVAINLKGTILACKHVIPIMRAQSSGAIVNISSMAAIASYPYVAYKATKAALIAFTEQLAHQNARYGIRANVILPGLINTPMAVDTRAREFNKSRADVEAERDAQVSLRRKWAPRGMSPMRRCSWPATKRTSSPVCRCPSMAAPACAAAEYLAQTRCSHCPLVSGASAGVASRARYEVLPYSR